MNSLWGRKKKIPKLKPNYKQNVEAEQKNKNKKKKSLGFKLKQALRPAAGGHTLYQCPWPWQPILLLLLLSRFSPV